MTTITTARATGSATPEAVFAVWADMPAWPQWNSDTAWVRLDGPCREGATGRLKPEGGPAVPFTVTRWEPGRRFTDVSRLWGARLTFDHTVATGPEGTTVTVSVDLAGPLAPLWRAVLGKGLVASAPKDLAALLARATEVDAATLAG
ncbi:MAG: SRPBCC family protein [Kineosporiaceae bacterium]